MLRANGSRNFSAAVALAFLAACGDDSPTTPPPPAGGGAAAPSAVQATAGDGQSAVVATALPQALVVKVTDAKGDPVRGAKVSWSTGAGGSVEPASGATDARGQAETKWTLGTRAGEQKATARVASLSAAFTATATPDRPARVALSPDRVVVGIDPGLDTASVAASVSDRYDNPIEDATVRWSSSDTSIARIDAQGRVRGRRPGEAILTAVVGDVRGSGAALVKLQMNAQCRVPTSFPARPAVGGMPNFVPEATVVSARHYIVDAAVLDLEGDRDQDVVLFENAIPERGVPPKGRITAWRNDGSGHFTDATAPTLGSAPLVPEWVGDYVVTDVNGDRRMDIFVGQIGVDMGTPPFPGARNLLFVQQPDGTLRETAAASLHPNESDGFTHSAAAADVDCDGDIDLFEANFAVSESAPPAHLQINAGLGTFRAEDGRLPDELTGRKPLPGRFTGGLALVSMADFCDLDRDGDVDLFVGMQGVRDLLLLNDGFGRFRFAPEGAIPEAHFGDATQANLGIRCLDFDLDGWPDLAANSTNAASEAEFYTRSHVALWRNNRNGTFTDVTATHLPQTISRDSYRRLFVADFNADAWPDLLLAENQAHYPRLFLNRGGRFAEQVISPPFTGDRRALPLSPIDADGDGRMDLYAGQRAGQHYLLRNR